jgi:hypothetical protein
MSFNASFDDFLKKKVTVAIISIKNLVYQTSDYNYHEKEIKCDLFYSASNSTETFSKDDEFKLFYPISFLWRRRQQSSKQIIFIRLNNST